MKRKIIKALLVCLLTVPAITFPKIPLLNFGNLYPELYFPYGTHSIIAVSGFGDTVAIEDGTEFTISPYDRAEVAHFRFQDPVIITQNHRWFSQYEYRLINQVTGSILEVNISRGPDVNGPYTRRIIAIDDFHGVILLNDSSKWQISSFDLNRYNGWRVGDAVIVGYNSGWDQDYLGILINIPMQQQHIRVGQL